jgi:hypothetical protein
MEQRFPRARMPHFWRRKCRSAAIVDFGAFSMRVV